MVSEHLFSYQTGAKSEQSVHQPNSENGMSLKDKEGGLNSVDMVKRNRWVDASRACAHEAGGRVRDDRYSYGVCYMGL